jgi:hypothetical protein
MSGIFSFNTKNLEIVLKEFGLRQSWLNILATHVSTQKGFEYILDKPEFKGATMLSADLLSELSIGDISVLYEFSVTSADSSSRKSNGQFFTPDDVAQFMVGYSAKFGSGVWLDPCSGIGNLSWHLVNLQKDPEKFLISSLILSDKDELALLIARTLLTVSFQKNEKRLFDKISTNFVCFDFLSVAENGKDDLFGTGDELEKIPKHDFVIVNPPYLAAPADSRFETAKSGDLYSYFLENIIKSSKGFISVTPQSFTNAGKFISLRRLLLRNYENLTIFNFDNVPANIFKGIKFGSQNTNQANSIRAAIMIAAPGMGVPRITSLLRWRSHEREELFTSAEDFLSDAPLTEEFFPKVSHAYRKIFADLAGRETLGSIVSSKKTKYPLFVPSAPRYFIPALKKAVQRASQKEIYFRSKEDQNYAYMLINSSYMYWWWRVRDGGMTLSLETLFSLPMLTFDLDSKIIKALEVSESTNKVYKQNAGAAQENVKHSKELITRLNEVVIPEYAALLGSLHENSEISQLRMMSSR